MWGQGRLAREALDQANKAHARIDSHENGCTQRWSQTQEVLRRVESKIDSLQTTQASQAVAIAAGRSSWAMPALSAMGALIILLIGAVGTLAYHVLTGAN